MNIIKSDLVKYIGIGLILAATGFANAEGQDNVEQLDHSYCRSCSNDVWSEVLPYLPRHDDGTLQGPIDDSTVMGIYRNLWKSAIASASRCLDVSAKMLVNEKVKRATCERKLRRK